MDARRTDQVRPALDTCQTLTRFPTSVVDTNKMRQQRSGKARDDDHDLYDLLVSRWTLKRHLLVLDAAMDRVVADRKSALRLNGAVHGVVIVTDEILPSQVRFNGFRF